MKRELEMLGPLVSALQRFFSAVEQGDEHAADRMIASVEGLWPEIPKLVLKVDADDYCPEHERDPRIFLRALVTDVGGVAETRLADGDQRRHLGWCRANLISDLERFKAASARATV